MTANPRGLALGLVLALASAAGSAHAQEQAAATDLTALDRNALRSEIESRYNAALARTRDPAIVAANTPAYIWASEAKAQCGIAFGYLRSGYKDPISIGKCDEAAARMNRVPAMGPPEPLPSPEPLPPPSPMIGERG